MLTVVSGQSPKTTSTLLWVCSERDSFSSVVVGISLPCSFCTNAKMWLKVLAGTSHGGVLTCSFFSLLRFESEIVFFVALILLDIFESFEIYG